MRTLSMVVVSAALVSLPAHATAQAVRSVGLAIGRLDSRQLQTRAPESRARRATALGLHVHLETPRSWLGVGVGLTFSPRGGEHALSTPLGTDPLYGPVHADYLTFSVLPAAYLPLGPLTLSLFAGPAVDVYLRGEAAPELTSGFRDPNPQVLIAVAGFSASVTGPGRVLLGVDLRLEEGLGSAYRLASERLRHRSRSISVLLGFRPTF
jgi:hypothetical protein